MCGDGKQAYRVLYEVYPITSTELQDIEKMICPKFESQFLNLASDISLRAYNQNFQNQGKKVLDELVAWVTDAKTKADNEGWIFTTDTLLRKFAELREEGKVEE